MLGGDEPLLFGGDVFTLGARRTLFGPGGLPVGFQLTGPREVASFGRFNTTAFVLGCGPPPRGEHHPNDQQDDGDSNDYDGYEHVW